MVDWWTGGLGRLLNQERRESTGGLVSFFVNRLSDPAHHAPTRSRLPWPPVSQRRTWWGRKRVRGGIWRASRSSSTPTATAGSLPTTTTAAAAERMCAARGAPPRPHALMHTALPTPPLHRPLLTTCLACLAADRVVFSTTNDSLLFLQTDDVGSAAGEEMVLDDCEGPKDDLGCVGTGVACACDWRAAYGRAVCSVLRTEREGPRRGQQCRLHGCKF